MAIDSHHTPSLMRVRAAQGKNGSIWARSRDLHEQARHNTLPSGSDFEVPGSSWEFGWSSPHPPKWVVLDKDNPFHG